MSTLDPSPSTGTKPLISSAIDYTTEGATQFSRPANNLGSRVDWPDLLGESDQQIVHAFLRAAEEKIAVSELRALNFHDILKSIGLNTKVMTKEEDLPSVLLVLLLRQMQQKYVIDYKYPTLNDFNIAYDHIFECESELEQITLWQSANWMAILFGLITAKKNKGLTLQVIPRLIEGWHVKYVTGSGQTQPTANRVRIFEIEGNCIPNTRVKAKKPKVSPPTVTDNFETVEDDTKAAEETLLSSNSIDGNDGVPESVNTPLSSISAIDSTTSKKKRIAPGWAGSKPQKPLSKAKLLAREKLEAVAAFQAARREQNLPPFVGADAIIPIVGEPSSSLSTHSLFLMNDSCAPLSTLGVPASGTGVLDPGTRVLDPGTGVAAAGGSVFDAAMSTSTLDYGLKKSNENIVGGNATTGSSATFLSLLLPTTTSSTTTATSSSNSKSGMFISDECSPRMMLPAGESVDLKTKTTIEPYGEKNKVKDGSSPRIMPIPKKRRYLQNALRRSQSASSTASGDSLKLLGVDAAALDDASILLGLKHAVPVAPLIGGPVCSSNCSSSSSSDSVSATREAIAPPADVCAAVKSIGSQNDNDVPSKRARYAEVNIKQDAEAQDEEEGLFANNVSKGEEKLKVAILQPYFREQQNIPEISSSFDPKDIILQNNDNIPLRAYSTVGINTELSIDPNLDIDFEAIIHRLSND